MIIVLDFKLGELLDYCDSGFIFDKRIFAKVLNK